jgi:hypothetical protein
VSSSDRTRDLNPSTLLRASRIFAPDVDPTDGILRANRGHPFYPGKQFVSSDPRLKWVIEPFDSRIHFALN